MGKAENSQELPKTILKMQRVFQRFFHGPKSILKLNSSSLQRGLHFHTWHHGLHFHTWHHGLLAAADKIVKTPSMGESITEGTLTQWLKSILLLQE